MKVVKPSYEILTPIQGLEILRLIERVGRVCYKSEDAITDSSAASFVGRIINSGHEAVIEHFNITVKFICNRGFTHELVRHRVASFAQESTRYCNYSADKFNSEITVVHPPYFKENTVNYAVWEISMEQAESSYLILIGQGAKPQEARGVLPIDVKTEVVITANLREWRHIFKLRTSKKAHPSMRELMVPLLKDLKTRVPVVFDDIKLEEEV